MKCEFCGLSLKSTERFCPNCGGINSNYSDSDKKKLEETINEQKDKIEDLEEDIKHYKKNTTKKIGRIVVIFGVIVTISALVAINNNIFTKTSDEKIDKKPTYSNTTNNYNNDELVVKTISEEDYLYATINDIEISVPMNVNDFIQNFDYEFPDEFIINANDHDYIYSEDDNVCIYAYNTTNAPLNYKDCLLGQVAFSFYNGPESIGLKKLDFYGADFDITIEEAEKLFGTPNNSQDYSMVSIRSWDIKEGRLSMNWEPDGTLNKITITNSYILN